MEHILSLSYGKDSLACLGAIEQLGWPLDRIVHAEVWATDTIPADLPPMVCFKKKRMRLLKIGGALRLSTFHPGLLLNKGSILNAVELVEKQSLTVKCTDGLCREGNGVCSS